MDAWRPARITFVCTSQVLSLGRGNGASAATGRSCLCLDVRVLLETRSCTTQDREGLAQAIVASSTRGEFELSVWRPRADPGGPPPQLGRTARKRRVAREATHQSRPRPAGRS